MMSQLFLEYFLLKLEDIFFPSSDLRWLEIAMRASRWSICDYRNHSMSVSAGARSLEPHQILLLAAFTETRAFAFCFGSQYFKNGVATCVGWLIKYHAKQGSSFFLCSFHRGYPHIWFSWRKLSWILKCFNETWQDSSFGISSRNLLLFFKIWPPFCKLVLSMCIPCLNLVTHITIQAACFAPMHNLW